MPSHWPYFVSARVVILSVTSPFFYRCLESVGVNQGTELVILLFFFHLSRIPVCATSKSLPPNASSTLEQALTHPFNRFLVALVKKRRNACKHILNHAKSFPPNPGLEGRENHLIKELARSQWSGVSAEVTRC